MNLEQVNEINTDIASPCVSKCCLNEQDVCLGCSRHIDEIRAWRQMDNKAKQQVLLYCQKRQQQKEQQS